MDGIAQVAKQQQTQINTSEAQGRVAPVIQGQQLDQNLVKDIQDATKLSPKINSKAQMDNLVDELNKAMAPMNTNLKFGVDKDDIFYVSVVETETSKMIRRFPAEKAMDFLPKMQEVSGMLFDTKG